jgi:hypothetical protein
MKSLIVVAAVLGAASSAFADGFVCHATNGSLTVLAYNNTNPSVGTRTAAVMVLSDPEANAGEKTIARFTDVKGTLSNSGASYMANVDLRFKDQKNKEALVAGKIALEDLDRVELDVVFSYSQPVQAGETVEGTVYLFPRAGGQINVDANCERYLKN